MAIKIITDSASDITVSNREDLIILPITITFHGTEYQDGFLGTYFHHTSRFTLPVFVLV